MIHGRFILHAVTCDGVSIFDVITVTCTPILRTCVRLDLCSRLLALNWIHVGNPQNCNRLDHALYIKTKMV